MILPKKWVLLLQILCLLLCASCQNLSVRGVSTSPSEQPIPSNWLQTSGDPSDIAYYTFGADQDVSFRGKRSAYLAQTPTAPPGVVGAFAQKVHAVSFRGQHVRVTAYLKTQDADGAFLWARADGQYQGHLAPFHNVETAKLSHTQDWTQLEVVVDIPATVDHLMYGVVLDGKGRLWVDDVQVEAISVIEAGSTLPPPELWPADVEERIQARLRTDPPLEQPQNLGFEQ